MTDHKDIYRQYDYDDDDFLQSEEFAHHMNRMTAEGLHSKGEIALEFAHRDREIQRLRDELEQQTRISNMYKEATHENANKAKRLAEEMEQHQWVKCSERLPEDESVRYDCAYIKDGISVISLWCKGMLGAHNGKPYAWRVHQPAPPIEADTGEQK